MKIVTFILAAVCAYLIAGINPAIVVSKLVYHKDIRTCGSGNPGFTNFKRTFGNKWAWWVLVFDLAKGAIAVAIFAMMFRIHVDDRAYQFGAAYTGLFALTGHSYPIWCNFKGGKGFLTYLSVIWFIDWRAGLMAVAIMMILLGITKYMSLSTVAAMLSCPITLFFHKAHWSVIALCAVCVLYIAIRHRENFKRLIAGTENKFRLRKSS